MANPGMQGREKVLAASLLASVLTKIVLRSFRLSTDITADKSYNV